MRLSVVSTLYNSEPYLVEFHRRVRAAAECIAEEVEIILVNDGSPDNSLHVARELTERDPNLTVIDLSRNFGHHKAMMTGVAHATGDYVFLIDSDLEEAPELLGAFYEALVTQNADVVYGVQRMRRGGLVERWSGRAFYRLFELLSDVSLPENLLTVRLMKASYVRALVMHKEREIFVAGLWEITGFHQIPFTVTKRSKGTSTYTLAHKISVLVNGVTSFSNKPLVLIFYLGALISTLSCTAAGYLVIDRMFFSKLLSGWASLIVSIWTIGGLMIFSIGIVGIYLSKVFTETKQRPYTIIKAIYGAEDTEGWRTGQISRRRAAAAGVLTDAK